MGGGGLVEWRAPAAGLHGRRRAAPAVRGGTGRQPTHQLTSGIFNARIYWLVRKGDDAAALTKDRSLAGRARMGEARSNAGALPQRQPCRQKLWLPERLSWVEQRQQFNLCSIECLNKMTFVKRKSVLLGSSFRVGIFRFTGLLV